MFRQLEILVQPALDPVVVDLVALGYAVLAPGLTFIGKQVFGEFRNIIPTALVMAAAYIVLNLLLTWLATWAQQRYAGERKIEVNVTGAGLTTAGGGATAV